LLKQKYKNNGFIQPIMIDKVYPIEKNFINLVIVNQQDLILEENNFNSEIENKDTDFRDERLENYETLHNITTQIEEGFAEIQKWESFLIAYKVYTEFGRLKNRFFYNSPEAEPSV